MLAVQSPIDSELERGQDGLGCWILDAEQEPVCAFFLHVRVQQESEVAVR